MGGFLRLCASVSLSTVMACGVSGAAAADTLLRWTEGSADRGPRAESFHWFADTVSERTGKQVEFQFYFGGALMGHAANVTGIGDGAADIGQIIASYTPKELLPYSVGDLPLVGADPWVGARAMYDLATTHPALIEMFDDLNLVYVSNLTTGPVQFICKGIGAKSLDAFKGVKARASGVYGLALADLGANVISLSQEDVYSALDTGLVSCNQQYVQGVLSYRQHEVTDQIILTNWGQILGYGVVMNKDTFDELTPEQQRIVRETGREFVDHYVQVMMRDAELAKQKLATEGGLQVVELSEQDVQKLDALSQRYVRKWIDDSSAAGVPAQDLFDKFMQASDKYRKVLDEQGYPWARK